MSNDNNNGKNNTGRTNFKGAVDKATGGGEMTAPADMTGGQLTIGKYDPAEFVADAASGEYEFAPQMHSIQEGEKVEGILEGNGPEAEFSDKETGVVRMVQTWILSNGNGSARISILSSAQLDSKLAPFVGGFVKIARDKDIKTANGYKVGNYLVGGKKLENGMRRTFAAKKMHVIEATATEQSQLAAGGEHVDAHHDQREPHEHAAAAAAAAVAAQGKHQANRS